MGPNGANCKLAVESLWVEPFNHGRGLSQAPGVRLFLPNVLPAAGTSGARSSHMARSASYAHTWSVPRPRPLPRCLRRTGTGTALLRADASLIATTWLHHYPLLPFARGRRSRVSRVLGRTRAAVGVPPLLLAAGDCERAAPPPTRRATAPSVAGRTRGPPDGNGLRGSPCSAF
eukprot:4401060-Pleurochrysis_carterae.AAC.1